MRRTDRDAPAAAGVQALGQRICLPAVRRLFVRFCHEVAMFPDGSEIEIAPFDLKLRNRMSGFCVTVSPMRELFLVSIGENRSFDVRVSSVESFMFALDVTLAGYLAAASKAASAA